MFEKELEEYKNQSKWKGKIFMKDEEICFKDGAELGYNKAFVEADKNLKAIVTDFNKANEWHFVKDELPPKKVPLNIITLDKNKKRRVWVGEYDGGNGQWWTGYFNHFIDVPYAWREIVLPKEIKEND